MMTIHREIQGSLMSDWGSHDDVNTKTHWLDPSDVTVSTRQWERKDHNMAPQKVKTDHCPRHQNNPGAAAGITQPHWQQQPPDLASIALTKVSQRDKDMCKSPHTLYNSSGNSPPT